MPQIIPDSQKAAVGEIFGVEKFKFPVYRSDDGKGLIVNFSDLGNPQGVVLQHVVAKWGREKPFSPMLFDLMGSMRDFPTENLIVQTGIELDPNQEVVGVASDQDNGVGLSEVKLVVNGPHGIDQTHWLDKDTIIVGPNDRRFFIVTAIGEEGGKQTITVQPKDAKYNLSVTGGVSDQFPNGCWIANFGRAFNSNTGAEPDAIQRRYNPGPQRQFSLLSRVDWDNWYGRDLPQHYMNAQTPFYTTVDVKVQDMGYQDAGPFSFIQAYVSSQQSRTIMQLTQNLYKALMFEDADLRKVPGNFTGAGLKPQINRDAFYSAGSRNVIDITKQALVDMRANNALAGDRIKLFAGTEYYQTLTEALEANNILNARNEINRSSADAMRAYYIGRRISGVYEAEFGGAILEIIEDQSMNATNTTGRRSTISPNVGGRAREAFMIDDSPAANLDLNINGVPVEDPSTPKVMLWGQSIPSATPGESSGEIDTYQYNYREGTRDNLGRPIQGKVDNYTDQILNRHRMTAGIALLDELAAFHLELE